MIPPAFQFYPDDWLSSASVTLLTLEAEGAYIRLLCYCWREGSLPNDPSKLAVLVGKGATPELMALLQKLFEVDKNDSTRLIHARLEKERKKQRLHRKNKSSAGKTGAKSRWAKEKQLIADALQAINTAIVLPMAKNGSSSPSSSSSSDGTEDIKDIERKRPQSWPSLEQVKAAASFINLPESEAVNFWNHYESTGWANVHNWAPKLAKWKANYEQKKASDRARGIKAATVADHSKGF